MLTTIACRTCSTGRVVGFAAGRMNGLSLGAVVGPVDGAVAVLVPLLLPLLLLLLLPLLLPPVVPVVADDESACASEAQATKQIAIRTRKSVLRLGVATRSYTADPGVG